VYFAQAVAGLQHKGRLAVQRGQQGVEFFALQRAACGHDTNQAGLAVGSGGLQRGFDTDDGQVQVVLPQQADGSRSGGVACHHQGLDLVLLPQVTRNGMGARNDMGVIALSVGGVAAVRHIHKLFVGQLGPQRAQHAEAAHAAVKHPDGVRDCGSCRCCRQGLSGR